MLRSRQNRYGAPLGRPSGWPCGSRGQLYGIACLAAFGLALACGLLRAHAQSAPVQTAENSAKTSSASAATSAPAPAAAQPVKPASANSAEDAGKQAVTSECADLLKMATDLKTEVDKTTKDTLSVSVVRKAGEIEQLAHKLRTESPKE